MPFGAELREDSAVRFRLWAPSANQVGLILQDQKCGTLTLERLENGWFELITRQASVGTRYSFQIDGQTVVPDPASRFQPLDVHGPSEVIAANAFDWRDDNWYGRLWEEAVIYELHVGAFTHEGTFQGVQRKLGHLRELGITAIELMPVGDFPGKRNWGYDAVLPFAPDSSYGRPDDLKQLVQAAHFEGLMIFLDVVYNHFGPDGNYLRVFSPQFFTDRHRTPWGEGINFDGAGSRVVREFFIQNALYWLEEYHFDGLRLDAVHTMVDNSQPDILTELARVVRHRLGNKRLVHLILENANNSSHYLCRDQEHRVTLYNAQWNDDIHHALHVVLTGESDGYYADYVAQPTQQLCRCLSQGFAFQGEFSEFHGSDRGEPSAGLPPSAFISFLQNHDQIGNRPFGDRVLHIARIQALKAAMEILLLAPFPPLLFMGEEFGATTPFLFFCNFTGDLAKAVATGRRNEFARFAAFSSQEARDQIPDPNAEQTFLSSKLAWECATSEFHMGWLRFYRELLSIRHREIAPLLREMTPVHTEFCAMEKSVVSVNWLLAEGARLELSANLGSEPLPAAIPHSGTQFYSSTSEAANAFKRGALLPWSVVWSVRKSSTVI